jgi:hypothetical protein
MIRPKPRKRRRRIGSIRRATHGSGQIQLLYRGERRADTLGLASRQRDYDEDQSTVTVIGVEGPEINDHVHDTAEGILNMAAAVMATLGNNNCHHSYREVTIIIEPESAEMIVRNGWSREDGQ